MFVDQNTIEEVEQTLLAVSQVSSVEIGEFYQDGKLGLMVCSILSSECRDVRSLVYDVEADLIQKLPGILFDFHTRVDMVKTFTTGSNYDVNYTWDISGEIA